MATKAIKKIIPLLDRILVQRAESVTTSKGGIVLPEQAQSKMMQGTVIAVGPGVRDYQTGGHVTPIIQVGDSVLLPMYGGTKVEIDDHEYLLFRESDILAKYE